MNARQLTATLAAGAALAVGSSVAQARMVSNDAAGSQSHLVSSQALKALDMRWSAIAKAYKLSQAHASQSLRPDNRAGRLGA